MKAIANFLFTIDAIIFERKEVQYFLLSFFVTTLISHVVGVFPTSGLTTWIEIGLAVYVALFVFRFATNKNELNKIKQLYKSNGVFPFIKGLTYCLLLGPIGLILAIFLALLPKNSK